MDKNEYSLKLQEIRKLIDQENYTGAAEAADQVDWRKVRNINTLCLISEVYEAVGRYDDSKALLLRAYRRTPVGRSILYRLVEVCVAQKQFDEAIQYYTEFVQAAPGDTNRYILKYKIYKGRGSSLDEQIDILKEYISEEYNEEYAYELAKLYQQADRMEECIAACDDLVLWFHSGKYVIKALELKKRYAALTPKQQEIYDSRFDMVEETPEPEDNIGKEKQIVSSEDTTLADTIMADMEKSIARELAAGDNEAGETVPEAETETPNAPDGQETQVFAAIGGAAAVEAAKEAAAETAEEAVSEPAEEETEEAVESVEEETEEETEELESIEEETEEETEELEEETEELEEETEVEFTEGTITSTGDTYEITVTYNAEAEIPEGAELEVIEVTEDSPEYEDYRAKAEESIEIDEDAETFEEVTFAKFFEIRIVVDGEVIEPKTEVQVSINLLDQDTTNEDMQFNAVYITEDEATVMDVDVEQDIRFETSELS